MIQSLSIIISLISVLFIGVLSIYCYAKAVFKIGGNLPSELKWVLEKAASLDSFIVVIVAILIISLSLTSSVNHISNHIILSLDILFFFNSFIIILFNTIKQMGFALCK